MAGITEECKKTARYILGNSNDFDPSVDKIAYKDLMEIDKWALNKLEILKEKLQKITISMSSITYSKIFIILQE